MPSYEEYIGSVGMTSYPWAFTGYALADGALMPMAQNSALHSLMSTHFGGDGRTTFALPNFNGRLPVGQGVGTGLSPRTVGQAAGAETVTLTTGNLPPHSHAVSLGGVGAVDSPTGPMTRGTNHGGGSPTTATSAVGQGAPVPIMPPTMAVSFLVALTGLYPVRG